MTPLSSEINTFDILTPARKYQVLSYGSRGDAVSELQQALTDLGYLNDKVDGIFGPRTRYAVRLFQDFNGFKVTGIADKDTQEYLFDGNPPVYDKYRQISYGARGLRVTEMQERLRYLGYMADPADGIYGPYTREGVRLFQEENGLNQSGVADAKTLKAIYSVTAPKCSSYFEMNYGDSGWRVRAMNRRLEDVLSGRHRRLHLQFRHQGRREAVPAGVRHGAGRHCQRLHAAEAVLPECAYLQRIYHPAPRRQQRPCGRTAAAAADLGYLDSGNMDGYYGRRTAAAVKEFQKMAGLPITGVANPVTQELLFGPDAPYKPVIAEISAPQVLHFQLFRRDSARPLYGERGQRDHRLAGNRLGGRILYGNHGRFRLLQCANGYLYDTEIKLDVTALHANEAYTITISAIPENGTMKNAKTSSISIVTPVREEPTPEPTPVPTPEEQ